MALAENGKAPYAPVNAVMLMIELFREKSIPLPITAAAIHRAGVEDSLARRTLATMKQLDLLDDEGNPTPTFQKIKVAGPDQYQAVMQEWLREAYKPIFTYCEPTDTEKVSTQFRHYEPTGMRNRMVTLFLGLCAAAGLIEKVPSMPRGVAKGTTPKPPPRAKDIAKKLESDRNKVDPQPDPATQAAIDRYAAMLMAKAEAMEDPTPDLLDRIERALGIQGASP
jgi:hypothetical protein